MHLLTRREMLFRAGIGIGAAHLGWSGCSRPRGAVAELSPPEQQLNEKNLPLIKTVTAADNTFGTHLLQEIWKEQPNTNVFLSPLSLAMALHMTLNGAQGKTLAAMQKALALDGIELERLNSANASLLAALIKPDPKVQLEIANGLWSKGLLSDFVARNKKYYGAEMGSLSGAPDNVNAWVKAKTKGKIETILNSLPPNVVVILVNAAYFKGLWTSPFEEARTKDDSFFLPEGQSLSVPMMTQTGGFPYVEGKGFQAIRLPYGSGRMNFLVILPDAGRLLEGMLPRLLSQIEDANMPIRNGTISLPRFQIKYEAELKPVLPALGMGIAFEADKADFSGMRPDSWIGLVRHKTFLEVNEEGTEAAAASAVVMRTKGAAIAGFDMKVNRPFCCAIHDTRTGVLLFLGAVVNPLA